jgi:urea transport system ATP-binding protein
MLRLERVSAFYGNSRALQDVSMDVADGEFVSVLGRNGVGKTTLMRAILGLMDKTLGAIELDGQDLAARRTHERARAGIGYVPQGRGILPKFTVRENLRVGTFASAHPKANGAVEERIFELFPMLKEHLNRRGGNLSGGQQQQLAIARALVTDPKIMLLDEPTEGIQPNIVEQIEEVIIRLNHEEGLAILLVEQDVEFARRASRRFVLMDRGAVAARGTVEELTDDVVHQHMAV